MPQLICMLFSTHQDLFVTNTSVNFIFINCTKQSVLFQYLFCLFAILVPCSQDDVTIKYRHNDVAEANTDQ